jgi:hypothetical protein
VRKGDDLTTLIVLKVEKIRSPNLPDLQGHAQACSGNTLPSLRNEILCSDNRRIHHHSVQESQYPQCNKFIQLQHRVGNFFLVYSAICRTQFDAFTRVIFTHVAYSMSQRFLSRCDEMILLLFFLSMSTAPIRCCLLVRMAVT